jgi:hypothetical protein
MSGAPLTIVDSQVMLPQPEWQLIAQAAKGSRNFAVQLEGEQSHHQRSWAHAHIHVCLGGLPRRHEHLSAAQLRCLGSI